MHDSYLIDGYNLIHALGMIRKKMDPGGLEESRRILLAFLAKAFGENAARVTIVFDAQHAPPGLPRLQEIHGLHVHFAPKDQNADDVIETLIYEADQPRALVVISNDHRLQLAAQRRGARTWSHDELLDFLEKRPPTAAKPEEESATMMSPAELKRWLKEFGRLESDPEFKEFFDHDRFE
jgi:predicted RNA-binding protein with PIN domain